MLLKNIIDDTNKLVLRRLGIEDNGQSVVYVDRQNIEVATQKLINSKTLWWFKLWLWKYYFR